MRPQFAKKLVLSLIVCVAYAFNGVALAQQSAEYATIQVGEDLREYRIYVPHFYSPKVAIPLVFNFHGTGNSPEMQEGLSGFEKLADKEGFVVVTPLALFKNSDDEPITWNVNKKPGPNDVQFISALLNRLHEQLHIDKKRIFATGFSGGARMSSRLGCDLSDTIAAIGPVAGIRFPSDCQPTRAMPVITFHGKKDRVNHYVHSEESPPYWVMGVEDALAGWVKNNACPTSREKALSDSVILVDYEACKENADVVFYRSSEAGHTWPGNPIPQKLMQFGLGKTEENLNATALIWQFFKAHPLP